MVILVLHLELIVLLLLAVLVQTVATELATGLLLVVAEVGRHYSAIVRAACTLVVDMAVVAAVVDTA